MKQRLLAPTLLAVLLLSLSSGSNGQDPRKSPDGKPPFFGPGFGPPGMEERKLVKQFDVNGDGWLNNAERQVARKAAQKEGRPRFPGGPEGRGGFLVKLVMDAMDTNKDSKLTENEVAAGAKALFNAVDAARDVVDEKQLAGALERLVPQSKPFAEGDPKGPKFPGGPPGGRFLGPGLAAGIVKKADADKDGQVTRAELLSAGTALHKQADKDADGAVTEAELAPSVAELLPPPGGFGPPGFGNREPRAPARPGPRISPADVAANLEAPLYAPDVLRTLFIEFENPDWEAELADFHGSDVEVPATLIVDGKKYANVGVHFRGMSSYMMLPAGYKRPLNLSLDFVDAKQRLLGYKTLNLLNSNDDPSLLSTILYSHIARQYIPAPKANFVKVVINGESWGLYINVQQFNKDFLAENYKNPKGARWKVRGSPGGGGGLDYLGENIDDYRRRYEIKSDDDPRDWRDLIKLCRTLNQTPLAELEAALRPMLDIDGALKFLALDVALSNSDGYWIRASDYSLFRDKQGVFHLVPHDMNEAFRPAMSFGMFGKGPEGGFGKGPKDGPPGAGPKPNTGPDPLVGLDDVRKPLRSRLLAVPKLKERYLEYVRSIAQNSLDWKKLGPVVAQQRALIEQEVARETRSLSTAAAFQKATADEPASSVEPAGRGTQMSLRGFADQRRAYLLNYRESDARRKETP